MLRDNVRAGLRHVGLALRQPEDFAWQWETSENRYPAGVWVALLVTAIIGTTTYGMTMGLLGGADDVLRKGLFCTLAAGLAWTIALPALYVLNSLAGSNLRASTTLLAALVTVSWGGLAMIASIPINWFFTTAIPHPGFVLAVNLVVFAGVGMAMSDVFSRVMRRLEPARETAPVWWLGLLGVTGSELFYVFELFRFA